MRASKGRGGGNRGERADLLSNQSKVTQLELGGGAGAERYPRVREGGVVVRVGGGASRMG